MAVSHGISISEAHDLIGLSRGAVGGFPSLHHPVAYCEGALHPIARNSESLK
jgi:hypothetical protein